MLKIKVLVIIISLLSAAVCSANVSQESAQELIAKYAANNKYCSSQVTISETISEQYKKQSPQDLNWILLRTVFTNTELRRQSDKVDMIRKILIKTPEANDVQNNNRYIWDTKTLYVHWFFEDSPENVLSGSHVTIMRDPNYAKGFTVGYDGRPFDGTLIGDMEPVSDIMARYGDKSVREQKEMIGGAACYVIDANGGDGKYTLWIDPEHGYNIVQAEVEKTGDKFSIKNVRLEQIQGYWIPMEGDFFSEDSVYKTKMHHKRISIDLNPDFARIGAFIPNLRNGTKIVIFESQGINYVWHNGKPVPAIDGSTFGDIDKTIDEFKQQQ